MADVIRLTEMSAEQAEIYECTACLEHTPPVFEVEFGNGWQWFWLCRAHAADLRACLDTVLNPPKVEEVS